MAPCTWCGHDDHPAACPRQIQLSAKPPRDASCPCARRADGRPSRIQTSRGEHSAAEQGALL